MYDGRENQQSRQEKPTSSASSILHPRLGRIVAHEPKSIMSLTLQSRFEERESSPKRRYAIFKAKDGQQWWLTLTIHFNQEAEHMGRQCVENAIYATKKPPNRKNALTKLFQQALDFSKIPFLDNTITRVLLRTNVGDKTSISYGRSVPNALCQPLQSYMDIPLTDLECFIARDDDAAIPFTPLDVYHHRYPQVRIVQLDDVSGIGKKESTIQPGVCKVSHRNEIFIYKEPHCPDDVISQTNEIESLLLLSKSPHVVKLHGLVCSQSPYLTRQADPSQLVLRGILMPCASQGNLRGLLANCNMEICWSQRLHWAKQIACGLQDIHDADIAHIDLKSHNVVIGNQNDALIIDFGRTGMTYSWNAPETRVDEELEELPLELLQVADIYSLGVLLWEIATRKNVNIPIGMGHEEFFVMDRQEIPKRYEELVKACLQENPEHRPKLAIVIAELQSLLEKAIES